MGAEGKAWPKFPESLHYMPHFTDRKTDVGWDWVTFKGKISDADLLGAKVFGLFFGCGVGFAGS